mgnify:CR=1 FL=1
MEFKEYVKKCMLSRQELSIFSKTGEIITVNNTNYSQTINYARTNIHNNTENKYTSITILTAEGNYEKFNLPYRLNLNTGKTISAVYMSDCKKIEQQILIIDIETGDVITVSNINEFIDSIITHEESRHVWLECIFGILLTLYWLIETHQGWTNEFASINTTSYSLSLFLLSMIIFFTKIDFRNKKSKYVDNLQRSIRDLVDRLKCPILCKRINNSLIR